MDVLYHIQYSCLEIKVFHKAELEWWRLGVPISYFTFAVGLKTLNNLVKWLMPLLPLLLLLSSVIPFIIIIMVCDMPEDMRPIVTILSPSCCFVCKWSRYLWMSPGCFLTWPLLSAERCKVRRWKLRWLCLVYPGQESVLFQGIKKMKSPP